MERHELELLATPEQLAAAPGLYPDDLQRLHQMHEHPVESVHYRTVTNEAPARSPQGRSRLKTSASRFRGWDRSSFPQPGDQQARIIGTPSDTFAPSTAPTSRPIRKLRRSTVGRYCYALFVMSSWTVPSIVLLLM